MRAFFASTAIFLFGKTCTIASALSALNASNLSFFERDEKSFQSKTSSTDWYAAIIGFVYPLPRKVM
jgi:hypothetical protein